MKRSAIVVALALGLMAQGAMAKTLNVVSSFSVLGDIAQQVGGEHVHVDTLVGPDGDPHTFEPSPKDSALLSKADVVVVNGLGLGLVPRRGLGNVKDLLGIEVLAHAAVLAAVCLARL